MSNGDEATERLIGSGTAGGLLAGIGIGAFAAGLAGYLLVGAADELTRGDHPPKGMLFAALGLILVTAAVNSAYSGVAAWRARRAGRPLRAEDGLAGENQVIAALERGEAWAVALVATFGLVLETASVAGFAAAKEVTAYLVLTSAVGAAFGAAFIGYALHRWRRPGDA